MTMRGAIQDVLAGLGLGTDPAEVLAEYGFEDLPPDAMASALVHFAETSDLELADALSPIVTRVSEVPFEEDDLPEIDPDAPLTDPGDVYALLTEVGLGGRDFAAMVDDDADLDGYDEFDEFDGSSETVAADPTSTADDDSEDQDEPTYGSGGDDDAADVEQASYEADEQDDETDDESPLGDVVDQFSEPGADAVSGLAEQFDGESGYEEYRAEDYDDGFDNDADPSDLDLD